MMTEASWCSPDVEIHAVCRVLPSSSLGLALVARTWKTVGEAALHTSEHGMRRGQCTKRLDFYFYSSSIPELIGRDRVDHQLYSGTFAYSGPRCGFWTLGQASIHSDVPQLSSNRRGPWTFF